MAKNLEYSVTAADVMRLVDEEIRQKTETLTASRQPDYPSYALAYGGLSALRDFRANLQSALGKLNYDED